jgi:hypothetical protein
MMTTRIFGKNRMLFFLPCLLLVTFIMGCATSGPTYSKMRQDVIALQKNKSRIIFYRPAAFFGFAMKADILLDGKKVGLSRNGTVFIVDVAPGKHKIQTSIVMYAGERSGDIELRQNETIYVKTYIGGSSFVGRTNFMVVSSEQAMADGIDDLTFIAKPI